LQLTGSAEFAAGRDEVWAILIDPTRLGPCSPIPIERVDDRRFLATARLGSGFFSAVVRVDIDVTDVDEGHAVGIVARGGASGTAVDGDLHLRMPDGPANGPTRVEWDLAISATGMFGPQAMHLIERSAADAVDRLVECLKGQFEG
jgi:carbon monoxide dehydrogenase subunit G